ncbi:hypothetical protein CVT24_009566, partial [Panaeolus cyanescens]
ILTRSQVFTASVHDVRYFNSLLRGINFVNRANFMLTDKGLTVTVEDSRALVGTAYIFSSIFDEFVYNPEQPTHRSPCKGKRKAIPKANDKGKGKAKAAHNSDDETQSDSTQADEQDDDYDPEEPTNAAFEIPLNVLIECLNIYGTAGLLTVGSGKPKGEGKTKRDRDNDAEADDGGRRGGLDAYLGNTGGPKTSMRLSYIGTGYPLKVIVAESVSGPVTTCQITTYEPEDHLELNFDNSKAVLRIILKSSWLRDALSEFDPACEKLTFIGNPPVVENVPQRRKRSAAMANPILRIQASGTFGSTEMDYPNDREVLENFECTEPTRFSHITKALKALQSSTKTSLRIDDQGMLSLQFLMPSPKPRVGGGSDAFLEFRYLPLDEGY